MSRPFAAVSTLALAAAVLVLPVSSGAVDRSLPMHFDLRLEGPAKACGKTCRLYVSASGAITADTPQDFIKFAQGRDLTGALVVLDSDGGSVHGAMALGREIRRLGLDTTVGRTLDLGDTGQGTPRAKLSPQADCESMCAFVLLAGVHRIVPPEARVMVHQIWLGDRRDDPMAANYSAEDLVLVQRDIGKLAQYTIEMGASIEVLDIALRIPPWEPMHVLTRDEISRARVATGDTLAPATGAVASTTPQTPQADTPPLTNGVRAKTISERRWAMVDHAGTAMLARRHPLTFQGYEIGTFDLMVSCGAGGDSYDVSYVERRHSGEHGTAPTPLSAVTMNVGYGSAALKVVTSKPGDGPDELVSYAAGTIPAGLIEAFARAGNHSMMIETTSRSTVTGIRIGNTGVQQSLPRLAAVCAKPLGDRAALATHDTGGMGSAK
jgi:hypothetical protein